MEVTLYWQASEAVDDNYVVFVHLLDGSGQLAANHDGPPSGGLFPTEAWLPGMTVPDTHTVPLPAQLAPGEYEIRVGLYDPTSGARLPVNFIGEEAVETDSVSLGSVTIE